MALLERYVSDSGDATYGGSSEDLRDEGTGATWSSGVVTIDLSADSPVDLSAVVTSGPNQDVIHLAGATGGHGGDSDLFLIDSVNDGADTLTVTSAPTNTDAVGAVWAIGGPWSIEEAAVNYEPGVRLNIKSDGEYTLSGDLIFAIDADSTSPIIMRGYNSTIGDLDNVTTWGNFPLINMGSNEFRVAGDGILVQNLSLTGNDTTNVVDAAGHNNCFYRCIIKNTGTGNAIHSAILITGRTAVKNCYLSTTSTDTTVTGGYNGVGAALHGSGSFMVKDCYIKSTRAGISLRHSSNSQFINNNVIFSDSAIGSHGIYVEGSLNGYALNISSNSIYQDNGSNTGDGINFEELMAVTNIGVVMVDNNIIEGWGAYAIDITTASDWALYFINNATYNNTSGILNLGDTPVLANIANLALSGSPFTDAANENFILLDDTTGPGSICRSGAVNYALDESGVTHNDKRALGAAEPLDSGGGSPSGVRNPMRGPIL